MRRRIVLIALCVVAAALGAATGVAFTGGPAAPPVAGPPTPHVAGLHYARVDLAGEIYPFAVYVPPGRATDAALPLVVVLHGCNMTAAQQAAASGYDALARQKRFVVLYPDVDPIDAFEGRCWKGIWNPTAEGRGRGDAGAIADMTRTVMARWPIDRSRVYAIGISAGAFETSILGAVYPDLYAAIGIHSGAEYMGGEAGCLGAGQSPAETAATSRAAFTAMGPRAHVMPVIIFHGDADHTVPYHCGQQALAQWLRTDDLVLEHERRPRLATSPTVTQGVVPGGGRAYTVEAYGDRRGCPVAELWTIHGMGHYWSGGSPDPASARYSDPHGPSAAVGSWAFFSHWRLSGPVGACARSAG